MPNWILAIALPIFLSGCGLFNALQPPPPPPPPEPPKIDVVARAIESTVALTKDEKIFCTGFASDGLIVTAAHCASEPGFRVRFQGGSYPAVVINVDKARDVATVDAVGARLRSGIPHADRGVTWGSKVVWLGYPLGTDLSLSVGVVANPSVDVGGHEYVAVDGQFIPGHSGGPVLNYKGDLIGVVSMTMSWMYGVLPIGYFVPLDVIQSVLETTPTKE